MDRMDEEQWRVRQLAVIDALAAGDQVEQTLSIDEAVAEIGTLPRFMFDDGSCWVDSNKVSTILAQVRR